MGALIPGGPVLRHPSSGSMNAGSLTPRSPCFTGLTFRSLHLQPPPGPGCRFCTLPLIASRSPTAVGLGFTLSQQARRLWKAESSSLSYRWIVHLLQLPTPPPGDAVAVGFRPESVCLERTCTSLIKHAFRRTGSRAPRGDGLGHGMIAARRPAPTLKGIFYRETAGRLHRLRLWR